MHVRIFHLLVSAGKILPEQQSDRMNPPMSFAAYTQAVPSEPAEPMYTGRRERRSSQRAARSR